MKKGKILSMILCIFLVLAVLASCSSVQNKGVETSEKTAPTEQSSGDSNLNPTGYPIFKDKVTLKVLGVTGSYLGEWEDNQFFKSMEEKTNIQLEFDVVDISAWSEKKNLVFVSGDLPDFFFKAGISAQEEISYSEQGLLIYVDEMIKNHAPNITKLFNEEPDLRKSITLSNGHIVSFPSYYDRVSPRINDNLNINTAWLEKLSLKEPTTIDELYNVLKAFKEKDPNDNGKADEIPFVLSGMTDVKKSSVLFGLGYGENGMFVNDDKKVYFVPMMTEFKDYLIFLRKLYQEGLLDNEFVTQTSNQVIAKGTENRLGVVRSQNPVSTVGAERALDYTLLMPIKAPNGKQFVTASSGIGRSCNMITNRNKYPEATVRWFDYLYTEEGARLTWMGVENQDFKINSDGTWDWILPQGVDETTHRGRATIQPGGGWAGICPALWYDTSDKFEKANIKSRERVQDFARVPFPMTYQTAENSKKVASIMSDLNGYVDQTIAKAITGDISIEREWDGYIAQLKKMNVEELVAIYQELYDEYLKK